MRGLENRIALSIRYAEAESMAERGGIDLRLEQAAWRGLVELWRNIRDDVATIERIDRNQRRLVDTTGRAR